MAVFRVERNKGYTVMSNHHLRNKELTLKAKGLLSQMLSLPEDWDYTLAGLLRRALSVLRQPKGETTIPLRKLRLLPFSELCVQTKVKMRLLSAHKVCPCAPLPCWQNVGVVYG